MNGRVWNSVFRDASTPTPPAQTLNVDQQERRSSADP